MWKEERGGRGGEKMTSNLYCMREICSLISNSQTQSSLILMYCTIETIFFLSLYWLQPQKQLPYSYKLHRRLLPSIIASKVTTLRHFPLGQFSSYSIYRCHRSYTYTIESIIFLLYLLVPQKQHFYYWVNALPTLFTSTTEATLLPLNQFSSHSIYWCNRSKIFTI